MLHFQWSAILPSFVLELVKKTHSVERKWYSLVPKSSWPAASWHCVPARIIHLYVSTILHVFYRPVYKMLHPRMSYWPEWMLCYAMPLHGMAWHGMALHCMAWHGMAWDGMGWHGMAWHGMTWHDMAWHGMARHGMTWHDMTWHDMTWHDMTWHDMTWHDMTWHAKQSTRSSASANYACCYSPLSISMFVVARWVALVSKSTAWQKTPIGILIMKSSFSMLY